MIARVVRSERGSALVLALLVTFILVLLGTSFLLMAQTESRIAQNEKLALQTRYVAEAGVHAVKAWFDRPGTAVGFPTPADVDRTRRGILDPADPYGATLGSTPLYKEGIDADDDGVDDLFRRPYRGSDAEALMGTGDAPDLWIDEETSADAREFLTELTTALVGEFPGGGSNLEARIGNIAIWAPPYLDSGSGWTRMGVATVRVTARIHNRLTEQVVAEQSVQVVLNEIPYHSPIFGPLHTCGRLSVNGVLQVRWGTVTAVGPIELQGAEPIDPLNPELSVVRESVPRRIPSGARPERLWATTAAEIADYHATCGGINHDVRDPWLRLIGGGAIAGPAPFPGNVPPDPLTTWQPWREWAAGSMKCDDWSNVIAEHPIMFCPDAEDYDYDFWKRLARSGAAGVHYLVPAPGGFRDHGVGPVRTFQQITHSSRGFFFFDTLDGLAPHDDDLDGQHDNLSPEITVSGQWSSRGFIFANSAELSFQGLAPGAVSPIRAPGEPFLDVDADGTIDAWINFRYPVSSLTSQFLISATNDFSDDPDAPAVPMRNRRGPPIPAAMNFVGILFTSGGLSLAGPQGRFYGGLVSWGDVSIDGASFGTVNSSEGVYWDGSIGQDWPPAELGLPLVAISRWESGP